jgi:hypothetical protein
MLRAIKHALNISAYSRLFPKITSFSFPDHLLVGEFPPHFTDKETKAQSGEEYLLHRSDSRPAPSPRQYNVLLHEEGETEHTLVFSLCPQTHPNHLTSVLNDRFLCSTLEILTP